MSRRAFRISLVLAASLSLVLRLAVPPNPLYGSPHDDELLVRLAYEIRNGNWLGDYSALGHLTHAKPPGLSLFLAHTHFLPWAPTLTVHLVILGGAALFARELRRMKAPRSVVLGFFLVVCLFPPFFGDQMSRIYREGLLTALTFLVIGLSVRLGNLLSIGLRMRERQPSQAFEVLLLALSLGTLISFTIIIKPSWYPFAVLALGMSLKWIVPLRWNKLRMLLPSLALVASAALVGLVSLVAYVVYNNHQKYRISVVDTFASGPFAEANNLWVSVDAVDRRSYVLVDRAQREAVYAVSPTARALQPFLELPWGTGWRSQPCHHIEVCDESAAWFPWELRDAVELAGLGDSAKSFTDTLTSLSAEIRMACEAGAISCSTSGLAPGVLPVSRISPRLTVDAFASGLSQLLTTPVGSVTRGPYGHVSEAQIEIWNETVRGLPDPEFVANVYRPESVYLGNVVLFSKQIFELLWLPMVLVGVIGLFLPQRSKAAARDYRWISVVCAVALAISLVQLSLLQASSGLYLSSGGRLYLLPSYPLVITIVACGWAALCVYIRDAFKPVAVENAGP